MEDNSLKNNFFQKHSPFLDDMNSLLHIAKQMGLIHNSYYSYLPNATKCTTIGNVKKSHEGKNRRVTVYLNDIFGMLILLGLGAGGALISLITENIFLVRQEYCNYVSNYQHSAIS